MAAEHRHDSRHRPLLPSHDYANERFEAEDDEMKKGETIRSGAATAHSMKIMPSSDRASCEDSDDEPVLELGEIQLHDHHQAQSPPPPLPFLHVLPAQHPPPPEQRPPPAIYPPVMSIITAQLQAPHMIENEMAATDDAADREKSLLDTSQVLSYLMPDPDLYFLVNHLFLHIQTHYPPLLLSHASQTLDPFTYQLVGASLGGSRAALLAHLLTSSNAPYSRIQSAVAGAVYFVLHRLYLAFHRTAARTHPPLTKGDPRGPIAYHHKLSVLCMARRIHKERVRRDYDFEERRRREVRSNGEGDTTRSGPSSSRPTSPARQLTDTNQGEREIPPPPPAIRRVAWRPAGALPPPSPTKPRRTARFAANPQEPTTQRSTVATPTRDEMDTATAWRAATLLDALLHEVARFQPTWIPEFSSSTDGSGHQKGSHDAAVDQVLGDLAADAARLTRVVETLGEEAAIGPNTAFAVGGGGGRPDSPMSPTSRPGSPTSDSRSKPFSPPRTPDRSFRSTTRSSPSGAAPVDGRPPLLATAMIAWTSAARQARFDALAVPKAVAAKSPRSTPTSPSSSMSPTRPPWNASPAIRAKHAASSATASSATASRKPSAAVAKAGM